MPNKPQSLDDHLSYQERELLGSTILAQAPSGVLPMSQMMARGIGYFDFVSDGLVVVRDKEDFRWVYATNLDQASLLFDEYERAAYPFVSFQEELSELAAGYQNLEHFGPCLLITLESEAGLVQGSDEEEARIDAVRPLDSSIYDFFMQNYGHPEWVSKEHFDWLVQEQRLLGAFSDQSELCGFIGEHVDGSMGMLQVLPEFRRQGWGKILSLAKIRQHLGLGYKPWGEVFGANEASLALQRQLGLKVGVAVNYHHYWKHEAEDS